MLSITPALAAALGGPVQQPAILVQVDWSTPQRWSSFATVTWSGVSWTKNDVVLDGLRIEGLRVSGTLVIGNADDVAAALVLSEGVVDTRVRVWGYDAAATATADVVMLCDAVGAAAAIDPARVQISLRSSVEYLAAPRTFVGPAAGFTGLLPAGTVVRINGLDYRMERR